MTIITFKRKNRGYRKLMLTIDFLMIIYKITH